MTDNDENRLNETNEAKDSVQEAQHPEPPMTYKPEDRENQPKFFMPEDPGFQQQQMDLLQFESVRKTIGASQIMALVSFLFGGALLSGAAIVVAFFGYRRIAALRTQETGGSVPQAAVFALKRMATIAIVMSVVAFVVNAVITILMYPTVMQMMQSSEFSSILGGGSQGSSAGNGSSFW